MKNQPQENNNQNMFHKLVEAKQVIDYKPSLFDDPNQNAPESIYTEYWKLLDIRNIIDTAGIPSNKIPNWRNVYEIVSSQTPKYILDNMGEYSYKWWKLNIKPTKNEGTELSRYACWAVMKFISNYKNTAFAQAYFSSPNKSFAEIDEFSDKIARVTERQKLTVANNILKSTVADAARKSNMPQSEVGRSHERFYQFIYTELFRLAYTEGLLNNRKPFADHMSEKLLTEYTQTLLNISSRWRNSVNQDYDALCYIAAQEIKKLRDSKMNGAPEQYLISNNISNISKELRQHETEFIKKFTETNSR